MRRVPHHDQFNLIVLCVALDLVIGGPESDAGRGSESVAIVVAHHIQQFLRHRFGLFVAKPLVDRIVNQRRIVLDVQQMKT